MQVHDDIETFLSFYESLPTPKRLVGYSKFAKCHYAQDRLYGPGTWLMFGSETSGLPPVVRGCLDGAEDGGEGAKKILTKSMHGERRRGPSQALDACLRHMLDSRPPSGCFITTIIPPPRL